ncbi:MAG: hypothetical protein JXB38_00225 [Anaerolineales bacterium]|nr:hypothetical protein [Anaerolineales bacterium]
MKIHKGVITFKLTGEDKSNWAITKSNNEIWIHKGAKIGNDEGIYQRFITHEMGHAFNNATDWEANSTITADLERPIRTYYESEEVVNKKGETVLDKHGNPVTTQVERMEIDHYDEDAAILYRSESKYHYYGYAGGSNWQFGYDPNNRQGEEFADMYVGWVFGKWGAGDMADARRSHMDEVMPELVKYAYDK